MKDRHAHRKPSSSPSGRHLPPSTARPNLTRRRLMYWLAPMALAAGATSMLFEILWSTRRRTSAADPIPATDRSAWRVGLLRPNGLRIIPGGRNDASHVLNPDQFTDPEMRHAYWVATQIPATLNQLYCWCGCENTGEHRSNLQCFEDRMALTCAVCRGTAEIAYDMTQKGVTDAGKIQAAVDVKWAPKG